MLLPIADELATRLYRRRDALFIHKHYNELYALVSAVEDELTGAHRAAQGAGLSRS